MMIVTAYTVQWGKDFILKIEWISPEQKIFKLFKIVSFFMRTSCNKTETTEYPATSTISQDGFMFLLMDLCEEDLTKY